MSDGLIELIAQNPVTIGFAFLGVMCIIFAILGEIPAVWGKPIDKKKRIGIGVLGAMLIGISGIITYKLASIEILHTNIEIDNSKPTQEIFPTEITKEPSPTFTETVVAASNTPKPTSTKILATAIPIIQRVCGPEAFNENSHNSHNPLFKRPEGYNSGWITSDPSDIVLSDGSVFAITTRYVLIVDDLPELQIQNVTLGEQHANTWGCWYREDITFNIDFDAEFEYNKMKNESPNAIIKFYRVSVKGLEDITP